MSSIPVTDMAWSIAIATENNAGLGIGENCTTTNHVSSRKSGVMRAFPDQDANHVREHCLTGLVCFPPNRAGRRTCRALRFV